MFLINCFVVGDCFRNKTHFHRQFSRRDVRETALRSTLASNVPPSKRRCFSFQVADRDTLTSVAARFDTTPSELTKLNRLATPYIFPGQQLYVPNRENAENESEGSTPVEDFHDDLPPEEKGKRWFKVRLFKYFLMVKQRSVKTLFDIEKVDY